MSDPRPPSTSTPADARLAALRHELRWSLLLLLGIAAIPGIGLGILLLGARLGPVTAGAVGVLVGSALTVPAARFTVQRRARHPHRPAQR